jgi:hypothetical protein
MAEIYFSGQGEVYAGTRDASGNVLAVRDLGNVPSLRLNLETDKLEHKESRTGQRLTDLTITRERMARVSMTLESFSTANLMMLLYGSTTSITGTSVTNETLSPTSGLVAGDSLSLAHTMIDPVAAFSIVDSAGSPITLTQGTQYTVDKNGGMITLLAAPGTQPYKANYTYLNSTAVPMFRQPYQERFLRFVGLNTANADKPVIVELYRVVFDPVSNFDLINDELAAYELEGSVLYDSTRDTSALLGGFGRVIQQS